MWLLKTVGHQHWRRNPELSDQLSHGKCTWDRHAAWRIIQYHPLVYDSPTNTFKILHSITFTIYFLLIKSLWNHRFFLPIQSSVLDVKICETLWNHRFFCPEVSTFFTFFHHFSPRTTPPWAVPDHPKPQPRRSRLVGVRLGWAAAQRGDVVPIFQEDQDVLVRLPAVVTPPEKDRKMIEQ